MLFKYTIENKYSELESIGDTPHSCGTQCEYLDTRFEKAYLFHNIIHDNCQNMIMDNLNAGRS